jgi:hypothetical protein
MDDDLESRLCGALPKKDIDNFAILMFEVNRGNPIPKDLGGLGAYGSNLTQISAPFRTHFKECYSCHEYFKDVLDVWEMPLRMQFFSDPQQNEAWKRGNELHRWFLLEHENIPQRSELQRYIVMYHKKKDVNPEFEEHIKVCAACTEYVAVQEKFKEHQ